MTPEENELLELLEQREGASGLLEFIHINRKGYEAPHHLLQLAEVFWRIFNGEELKVCISIPPRHGKTETIDTMVAKFIAMFPHKTVGYISYGSSLAKKQSLTIRNLVKQFGIKLEKSSRSLSEWRVEGHGGGFICCGRDGALTGYGVDLLIIDDPIKNREEAESITIKDKVEAWFTSTAMTRIEPGGSVIVNATRWAKDDLIGRIMDKESELEPEEKTWEMIRLPAIDEHGNALWPSRWPIDKLKAREIVLGPYDFESLYQGSPIPKSGVVFKAPEYYSYANVIGGRWAIGVDSACSTDNHADNTVITVICAQGEAEEQIVDVIYQWAGKLEYLDVVNKIKEVANEYKAPIYIESNGVGKGVAQALRRTSPGLKIYEKHQTTDKFTRALELIAAWNTGRVRLPKDIQWAKELVKESQNFTAAGSGNYHDDRIDSLEVCFSAITRIHKTNKSTQKVQALRIN